MKFATDDPEVWRMASEMCADDTCFWSNYDQDTKDWTGLSLAANVNDVFAGAADAEDVPVAEVPALYAAWMQDGKAAIDEWAGTRRGQVPYAWRKKP